MPASVVAKIEVPGNDGEAERDSPVKRGFDGERLERATGIEPVWPVWKTGTLPLSYARSTLGQSLLGGPVTVKERMITDRNTGAGQESSLKP